MSNNSKNNFSNNNSNPSYLKYWDSVSQFSNAIGASGYEKNVRDLYKSLLKNEVDSFIFDKLGSVAACKKSDEAKFSILIDAHMDEIGFMVSRIDENGFIWFNQLGGWWGHSMLAKRFRIVTNSGKIIIGIVGSKPIHILPVHEREKVIVPEEMYLDIGAKSKEEVLSYGINIGNYIVKDGDAFMMANNRYVCSKAIDNRASCAVVYEVMKYFCQNPKKNANIYGALSVQEEVGLRGAKTLAYAINPQIAFVIDTTLSYDQPGMPPHDCKLDEGVTFTLMDRTIISHPKLINKCVEYAQTHNFTYTYNAKVAGGTNGGTIHLSRDGIPTVVISIPTRYLHTHNEVCSLFDIEQTVQFLIKFIENFTFENYKELINY